MGRGRGVRRGRKGREGGAGEGVVYSTLLAVVRSAPIAEIVDASLASLSLGCFFFRVLVLSCLLFVGAGAVRAPRPRPRFCSCIALLASLCFRGGVSVDAAAFVLQRDCLYR